MHIPKYPFVHFLNISNEYLNYVLLSVMTYDAVITTNGIQKIFMNSTQYKDHCLIKFNVKIVRHNNHGVENIIVLGFINYYMTQ